jgi:hypothetical protein
MMRRFSIAAVVAIVSLVAAGGASAGQRSSQIFSFADPFTGAYDCGTFPVTYSGHDDGRVTDWFNAAGDPIKEIGHIQSWETDVNTLTGKSIYVTTDLMVHMDFVAGTVTITGKRNSSTVPGHGIVVQHVGRVVLGPNGQPISLSGKYPEFQSTYMSQDFCAALA